MAADAVTGRPRRAPHSSCLAARAPSGHRHRQRSRAQHRPRRRHARPIPTSDSCSRAPHGSSGPPCSPTPTGASASSASSRSPGRPPGRRSCSARTTGFPVGWRSSFPAHRTGSGPIGCPTRERGRAAASARPCRRLGLPGRRRRCPEDGRPRVAERLGRGRDDRGRRRCGDASSRPADGRPHRRTGFGARAATRWRCAGARGAGPHGRGRRPRMGRGGDDAWPSAPAWRPARPAFPRGWCSATSCSRSSIRQRGRRSRSRSARQGTGRSSSISCSTVRTHSSPVRRAAARANSCSRG